MKKIFILICLLLFVQTMFGQSGWKKFYDESFDYFYNAEYDKAIECLEEALALDPTQPAIYWRLTYIIWFPISEAENKIPNQERDELEKLFNNLFDKGVKICENLLTVDSANVEALFYLGGLYGNRVFFKQAVGQRNKSMLDDTNKSREYLRKIKKTKNFYYEACGYLGMFNYGPILMSGFQKWLVRRAGCKWDEDKGLLQTKDAIKNSRYGDDIKFLYKGILMGLVIEKKRRNKIPEALYLVEELIKKYPRNSILKEELKTLKDLKKKK